MGGTETIDRDGWKVKREGKRKHPDLDTGWRCLYTAGPGESTLTSHPGPSQAMDLLWSGPVVMTSLLLSNRAAQDNPTLACMVAARPGGPLLLENTEVGQTHGVRRRVGDTVRRYMSVVVKAEANGWPNRSN